MVNNQVPVIMNIADQITRGAILAANKAEEDGAAGYLV